MIKLLQYVFGYAVVKLSDIATITRGGNFQKKDFCEEGVPCIHYGQIYTYYGTSASKTITMITQTAADKSKFVERFPEFSLFYRLFSPLDSEMICIFPYFYPCEESAREIREIFI